VSRISYLNKINASLDIKKNYLQYILFFPFIKKNKKKFVKNFRESLKDKCFTYEFFSQNSYDWNRILTSFKNREFKYMEIGSFEGNSALFILNNFSHAKLTCVDPWIHLYEDFDLFSKDFKNSDKTIPEKNFDKNLLPFFERYKKYKMRSNNFFITNKDSFDIIYVDGSHLAKDVLNDCLSSWKILNNNGIMIMDDYFFQYPDQNDNPGPAINKFLKTISKKFEILKLTKHQLFIKKINN